MNPFNKIHLAGGKVKPAERYKTMEKNYTFTHYIDGKVFVNSFVHDSIDEVKKIASERALNTKQEGLHLIRCFEHTPDAKKTIFEITFKIEPPTKEKLFDDLIKYGKTKAEFAESGVYGDKRIRVFEYENKKYFVVQFNGKLKNVIEV